MVVVVPPIDVVVVVLPVPPVVPVVVVVAVIVVELVVAVVPVDVVVVVVRVVVVVVACGDGHATPSPAAPGNCWQATWSAAGSAAAARQVETSASDPIATPHAAGHTSHHGGSAVQFWSRAVFFASAASIFFCAPASGQGPGIFPARTAATQLSIAFSRAR